MAAPPEQLSFWRPDVAPVVDRMADLAARLDGWINLQPDVVEDDDDRPGPGFFALFSGGGPPVPLCTWSPGERTRRGTSPASVGIQHGAGPKAAARLVDAGVPVPPGWPVVQDHPRRGLVARVPVGQPHERVLAWLLDAGEALCARPVTGRWSALVFTPGRS